MGTPARPPRAWWIPLLCFLCVMMCFAMVGATVFVLVWCGFLLWWVGVVCSHWRTQAPSPSVRRGIVIQTVLIVCLGSLPVRWMVSHPNELPVGAARDHVAWVVRLMVMCGGNPNAHMRDGHTVLGMAAKNGMGAVVQFLLERGAEVHGPGAAAGHTPALILAAGKGHTATVEMLVAYGARMHARDPVVKDTVLIRAASRGRLSTVALFLAHGAEVEAKNAWGRTALLEAAVDGHVAVIESHLQAGADVNAQERDGCTALHIAAMRGLVPVVATLLRHGGGTGDARSPRKDGTHMGNTRQAA